MKKLRFTETQVALALRQAEEGTAVGEMSRQLEISEQAYYWRRKNYGGTDALGNKRKLYEIDLGIG